MAEVTERRVLAERRATLQRMRERADRMMRTANFHGNQTEVAIYGAEVDALDAALRSAAGDQGAPAGTGSFQYRSAVWMERAFSADPTDQDERRDRFAEESIEVAHALGITREDHHRLVDYVHSRPLGDPAQEIGQAEFTLACLADFISVDMIGQAERELARCSTPEFLAKLSRKRSTRHGRGSLPGLSDPASAAPCGRSPEGAETLGSAREHAVPEGQAPHSPDPLRQDSKGEADGQG